MKRKDVYLNAKALGIKKAPGHVTWELRSPGDYVDVYRTKREATVALVAATLLGFTEAKIVRVERGK